MCYRQNLNGLDMGKELLSGPVLVVQGRGDCALQQEPMGFYLRFAAGADRLAAAVCGESRLGSCFYFL